MGGAASTSVDDIVIPRLELATSEKHNDLILRCVFSGTHPEVSSEFIAPAKDQVMPSGPGLAPLVDESDKSSVASNPEHVPEPREFQIAEAEAEAPPLDGLSPRTLELEFLRAEVAQLRKENKKLRSDKVANLPCSTSLTSPITNKTHVDFVGFDDPSEPPPAFSKFSHQWISENYSDLSPTCGSTTCFSDWSSPSMSPCGTGTPMGMNSSEAAQCFSIHSGTVTPIHSGYGTPLPLTPRLGSDIHSGAMSPGVISQASPNAASVGQQVCALVPMWFNMVGDRCVIPGGIVDRFKAKFEPTGGQQLGSSHASEALNFSLG